MYIRRIGCGFVGLFLYYHIGNAQRCGGEGDKLTGGELRKYFPACE